MTVKWNDPDCNPLEDLRIVSEAIRGYNFITAKGIEYLLDLGIVHP